MSRQPHFGHTKTGLPVHARTIDHHKGGFNKAVAVWLTNTVGTMATFWVFCVLALLSLPAVLSGFSVFAGVFPAWMIKASIIALIAWVAQTFIQLVLLPALMVGQNLQNVAADARAAKTFEDLETVKDWLDLQTKGGLTDVHQAVEGLRGDLAGSMETIRSILSADAGKRGDA